MKKNIKYKALGVLIVLFAFPSCDTADQVPSEIISPDYKPKVTVTSDLTGKAIEGKTITYTITFDKAIDRAVTFSPRVIGGTADEDDYVTLEPVIMEPYTKTVEFKVDLKSDYLVEDEETLQIQLEILGISDKFLVNPNTVIAPLDIKIAIGDPTLLTINFSWDNDNDIDLLVYSDTATYPAELWGTDGATSFNNPEIDHSIWLADPLGDYYVCVLDYESGSNFNYTFRIAQPDNTIEIITGTFDAINYPYEHFTGPADWGSPNAYKVLKVVNNGTKFVITKL